MAEQKRRDKKEKSFGFISYNGEGKRRYSYKKKDINPKKYLTVPGIWKIISCIRLKEIDNDSSVNASSFLIKGEKLINFSATPATDAEFVLGYYTKIARDLFHEGLLSGCHTLLSYKDTVLTAE